jgi:hypothetical protein
VGRESAVRVRRVPEGSELDERELRAAQGAIAVLLLGAFVFRVPALVIAIAVIVAIGAIFGPQTNAFNATYRAVVGPRLAARRDVVTANAARSLDALDSGLLVLASGAIAVGLDSVAWAFTLLAAVVATVEATTGYNAATALAERLRRDG